MFKQVENHPKLVRDSESNAILNLNASTERTVYLQRRTNAESRMKEIEDQKTAIQSLKDELAQMREMFSQLVK